MYIFVISEIFLLKKITMIQMQRAIYMCDL